jgi:hypothetical protein
MIADVNNNFYLDVTNTGLTTTQVSLFGLGQVGFDFATFNLSSVTYDYSTFVTSAGLTIYPITQLVVAKNLVGTTPIGTLTGVGTPFVNLAPILEAAFLSAFPNSNPRVYITQVSGSIFNIKIYTLPTLYCFFSKITNTIGFPPDETVPFSLSTEFGNTLTPNISVSSQTPYNDLRQSLNGTVYSLVCFDLNSQNDFQLTQPITFRRKNAFGDREISSITPVIDPYAGNAATIGKVDLYNFLLDEECSIFFNMYGGEVSNNEIVPNTIRLYFYYAKWTVENFKNFEMAYRFGFLQEIYNLEQLMTEQRLKSILLS